MEQQIIECHECKRQFAGQKAVRRHYTLEHERNQKHLCDVCYWPYVSRSALERHQKAKHNHSVEYIVPTMNTSFTKAAMEVARDKYQSSKNTETFKMITESTGLQPSQQGTDKEVSTLDYPHIPKKPRRGLLNTINDADYRSLNLNHLPPALTPIHNIEKLHAIEESLTQNALTEASNRLNSINQHGLAVLSVNDVEEVLRDTPTPTQDERDDTYHTNNSTTSSSSNSSNSSSSDSSSPIGSISAEPSVGIPEPSPTLVTDLPTSASIGTNTERDTAHKNNQTITKYLPSTMLLQPGRYTASRVFLWSVITILNEVDTNLALDFAYLVNIN